MAKPHYPLLLNLDNRPVLVVGAGRVAARKLPELLRCGARVTVVAPRISEAVRRQSAALELLERSYSPGDERGRQLVLAVTDDPRVNEEVAARCRKYGIPCNAGHSARAGTFHSPAVIRRGDIVVAIGTEGRVPGLTRHLKHVLSGVLRASWGELAEVLAGHRAELQLRADAGNAESVYRSLPYGRLLELLESDGREAVREELRRLAEDIPPREASPAAGVTLVGAGPGHPGLVTLMAKESMETADVIIHDRLIPRETLQWAPPGCILLEAGKRGHFASVRQEEIEATMIRHARRGLRVVRLKGGDPFLFGRGWEEVRALEKAGIPWRVIPGLSSTTAAPTWAGIPLTTRGKARSYAVMSGMAYSRVNVDIPHADTIVLVMGLHKLGEIVPAFLRAGWAPATPAAAVQAATMPEQKTCFSTLARIEEEVVRLGFDSPTLLVIGEVVDLARSSASRQAADVGPSGGGSRAAAEGGPADDTGRNAGGARRAAPGGRNHESAASYIDLRRSHMQKPKSFYVTTPIYYVNDVPHIGHAYTTILADVLARYHKLTGVPAFFLTGTDEHGQKVQQAAEKKGHSPQEHCDIYSRRFKDAWERLGIGYDKFIRTTDPDHVRFVQEMLQRLWDKGLLYAQEYEGWYSTSEERFFSERELVDGKDPISGRPVEWILEKNYFFRMSQYQGWLIGYIESNPDFILPEFRRNEVLGFLRQPLNDLCISRPKSRLSWGVTLPFDGAYVAYVWVDALFNYVSAVVQSRFADGSPVWPADFHLIGKDILTTHAVYWPTLLKAVDLPLPRHIFAHGWWMLDNARMSKTTGNVVNPMAMADHYGVDAFRYFLTREMVLGLDASFSEEAFVNRLNSDLANDLGNGLSRILKLAATGLGSRLEPVQPAAADNQAGHLRDQARATVRESLEKVYALKLSQAVEDILQLVRAVNRFLEMRAPWKLDKGEADYAEKLNATLFPAAEALRLSFTLLLPVMPEKMAQALVALGIDPGLSPLDWGGWRSQGELARSANLFPRVSRETDPSRAPATAGGDDPFAAVDLRAARVMEVSDHPGAEKLFVLKVDLGGEMRTLCAGLKGHIDAAGLLGKTVVVVANLKPAVLRGVRSEGMLLAAPDAGGRLRPVNPEGAVPGIEVRAEGLEAHPAARLSLDQFLKAPLRVKDGVVRYGQRRLATLKGPVRADAPDGAEVR